MNTLGKVFVWLIVVASLPAVFLTARMLDIRNSWAKAIGVLEKKNETNDESLVNRRLELFELQSAYDREMQQWDRYFTNTSTRSVGDGNPNVAIRGLGGNNGLTRKPGAEPQVIYGFQTDEAGASRFVGEFRVLDVGELTEARATWTPREGEIDRWNPEKSWRWRTSVPSAYIAQFNRLQVALTAGDETLDQKDRYLSRQLQILESAKTLLAHRLRELTGGDPNIPREVGLVAQIEEAIERRNEALLEMNRLRQEAADEMELMQKLIDENSRLAKSLPQPEPKIASKEAIK